MFVDIIRKTIQRILAKRLEQTSTINTSRTDTSIANKGPIICHLGTISPLPLPIPNH